MYYVKHLWRSLLCAWNCFQHTEGEECTYIIHRMNMYIQAHEYTNEWTDTCLGSALCPELSHTRSHAVGSTLTPSPHMEH